MVNSFLWIWDQRILCILKGIRRLHLSACLDSMMKLMSLRLKQLRNKFQSLKSLKLSQMSKRSNLLKKL